MKIALHDSEKISMRNKSFPNYALMKLSAWHKQQKDRVEWFNPSEQYDKIYSSKIFTFKPDDPKLTGRNVVKGGTGYGNFEIVLSPEIDQVFPDYEIYDVDYSIGFITRGCIRKCPFCVVPKKEGELKSYRKWQELVRPGIKKLVLMDNNILASSFGIMQLEELSETDYKIDLNQGMDARLVDENIVKIIKKIKWIKFIRFSCDSLSAIPSIQNVWHLFKKYEIPLSRVSIYFIVRRDLQEASKRLEELKKFRGFNIYAQAERSPDFETTREMKEFANRYIYGHSFRKETWEQYLEKRPDVKKRFYLDFSKSIKPRQIKHERIMMKIFVDSKNLISDLEFLTGISEFRYPQFVLESNKSGVKTWLPGAEQYPRPVHIILNPATHKIGWTGRVYADSGVYESTQYKYPYRQKIIGIDLDEVPVKLFPSLVSLHLPCSIRVSKSGVKEIGGIRCVGLHLLFRTKDSTNFFDTEQVSNPSIKITLAPFKQQIINLGIPVCQANFRTFWLWTNGQNRWYSKTGAEIDLVRSGISSVSGCQIVGTGRQIDTSEYSERGKMLVKLLQDAKVLPEGSLQYQRTQIWVKQVWEALKGTQFEFQTCSPMQSTSWHSNGFLDISNLTIDLFTNADNKIVLRVPTRI